MTDKDFANAQTDRSVAPPVKELTDMNLPPVRKRTLANGSVLTLLDQGVQPVGRLTLQWNRGSADVEDQAALSMLMSMLLEGTNRFSGAEIAETLEFNGAWKATETAKHHVSISFFLLNQSAEEIFPLVRELITGSVFPESTLASLCERQAAQAEIRQQKVDTLSRQEGVRMAYGTDHPFSRVITPDELRAVTRERVMALYHDIVRSFPPEIYLSGRIQPGTEELAADIFGAIEYLSTQAPSKITIPASPLDVDTVKWIERPESLQTAVTVTLPVAGMSHAHPDYELLRVAVTALGGYFGSRLMSNIREDKGYTYGISAYLSSTEEGAFITIATQTDNSHVNDLLHEVELELKRLSEEPPSDEEMAVVRRTMTSNLAAILDSPFTVMDYHRQVESLGFDGSRFNLQLNSVASATPEGIRRMADCHILPAPRLIALAGCQSCPAQRNTATSESC